MTRSRTKSEYTCSIIQTGSSSDKLHASSRRVRVRLTLTLDSKSRDHPSAARLTRYVEAIATRQVFRKAHTLRAILKDIERRNRPRLRRDTMILYYCCTILDIIYCFCSRHLHNLTKHPFLCRSVGDLSVDVGE